MQFPERFTDRWADRERESFDDSVCWHVLLGGDAAVRSAAAEARRRLAGFSGLHWTPERWLHMTVCFAGRAAEIGGEDMGKLVSAVRAGLAGTAPVTVALERITYHPQGIMLAVSHGRELRAALDAVRSATREVTGSDSCAWRDRSPHVTLCYSTAERPATPVAAALGTALPRREVTIDRLSLVVQNGPERAWDWRVVGTASMEPQPRDRYLGVG